MALRGALREVFAVFGVEVDPEKNLEKGHKEVSGLKEAFEGLVAAAAGSELFNMTREFGEQLGQLAGLSQQTGLATEQIQVLTFAAEQNAGSVDEMNASLLNLQKSLRAGKGAAGPQTDALTRLGIAMTDAAGQPRELNEVLPSVFENFSKLKNPAEEATVATELFGRSGIKLLPTLRLGAEGLEKYRAELDELGGPVSDDTIEKAEGMNNAFIKMDRAFFSLKATIGSEVFPQIEKLITGFAHGIARIGEFAKGTTLAQSGTLALGAAIAGPLLTALGPLLKPGLKFAALFLAMDDAVAFIQGKDSVIGAILNSFFGPETTAGVHAWTAQVVADFGEVISSGTGIFHALEMAWGDTLNDMVLAFHQFILGADVMWNELVDKLHLPDSFKIDLADADARVAEDKRVHAGYEQEAYDSTHPKEVAARQAEAQRQQDEENGHGERSIPYKRGDAGKFFGAQPAAPTAGEDAAHAFGIGANVTGPKVLAPVHNFAADFAPAAVPLPPAPAHTELHVDARTTVHATTTQSAKEIADTVQKGQKESWRNAYESLTTRSNGAP